MQMIWRAVSGVAPLLEHAKLRCVICRRSSHTSCDARSPLLAWLLIHIDDTHRIPKFVASKVKGSLVGFATEAQAINHLGITVKVVLHETHIVGGAVFLHVHAKDSHALGHRRFTHNFSDRSLQSFNRFDRDVLAQPGVANLIVLEGINDIGWPHMKPRLPNGTVLKDLPFTHEVVSAEDLIMGLRQIVDRAHQHGIRVFGATLTPYEGADYYSDDGEAERQAVNQWIRTGGAFDGVFDFDAAVRDPQHPSRFREEFQSGDHLHPSAAGYKAMADAVDLAILNQSRATGK